MVVISHTIPVVLPANLLISFLFAFGFGIAFRTANNQKEPNDVDTLWVRAGIVLIGAVSVYVGYQLFCNVPQENRRLTNIVAGALLAVLGLGIMVMEIRAMGANEQAHRRLHRSRSTEVGSYDQPVLHRTNSFERIA